jgi:SPP1 family predicted phage head-tail adaptor
VNIGTLDRRVRVEQKTITQDPDYGSQVETWATYIETWASVQDITSGNQERTNSDLRQLKRPCRIRMRYLPDIDATMRVILLDRDDRVLQIVSKPAELGRKDGIEFMAEEYQP